MFSKEMTDTLLAQLSSLDEFENANEFMQRVVEMIQAQNAEFVGVSIFLKDSSQEFANMLVGTGGSAQQLLERGHRYKVAPLPTSPGSAIYHNEIQLVDYRSSFTSPKIGMIDVSFPLQVNGDAIGAIEVSIGAFDWSSDKQIKIEQSIEFLRFTDLVAQRIRKIKQSE